jgi:cytochrome c oxidase subunit 1
MTTASFNPLVDPAPLDYAYPDDNYISTNWNIKSWLLTVDHKRIGMLYLFSISFFFLLGGLFATLMRIELATPKGDLVEADTYNRLFTMHGVTMIFFFLVPAVPAVLGNFVLPIMIGARDLALPRINLLSWWLYIVGGICAIGVMAMGGVDTGWTFYTPYSSTFSQTNVVLTILGIFVAGFSSIFTGLNFIVTVHTMRCPGMTWFRMPLFVWANYATSLIMVLGTPVVAIAMVLVLAERLAGVGIFDPRLGGDPILFQHLFWFYSHPAVYIMILPGFGVISEVVTCFSRKKIFGYSFIAFSSLAIALLGFLVWGHHMFVTGMSTYGGVVFSLLSFMIAIPTAIKIFNWIGTMYKGSIVLTTPMLYAVAFIGLFTIGGLTGLFLSTMAMDVHLTDTYFVIAHFHYVMVGGMVTAFLAGLHFWWPKMTGRMYNDIAGRVAACLVFAGFNLTFFPQFVVGYLGMPRRYHAYPDEFQVLNVLSSAGASVLAIGFAMPMVYLLWSLKYGKIAGPNPWGAAGLEWQTTSPPPTFNFDETPVVTQEAYAYEDIRADKLGIPRPVPTGHH